MLDTTKDKIPYLLTLLLLILSYQFNRTIKLYEETILLTYCLQEKEVSDSRIEYTITLYNATKNKILDSLILEFRINEQDEQQGWAFAYANPHYIKKSPTNAQVVPNLHELQEFEKLLLTIPEVIDFEVYQLFPGNSLELNFLLQRESTKKKYEDLPEIKLYFHSTPSNPVYFKEDNYATIFLRNELSFGVILVIIWTMLTIIYISYLLSKNFKRNQNEPNI